MIHDGKHILAVALTVGIVTSIPAVNGDGTNGEPDDETMGQIYGLNPGEYPITRGSLSGDTAPNIDNPSPSVAQISDFAVKTDLPKQANPSENLQIQTPVISKASMAAKFIIQAFTVPAAIISSPIDIAVPAIVSRLDASNPLNIYWENVVMANEASPFEKILTAIQMAMAHQPFEVEVNPSRTTEQAAVVSIPISTIQSAQFIDLLTITAYSTPKIKTSDIPIDMYANIAHPVGYSSGMELYQHTIQKMKGGASVFDIYTDTVEALGEENPISIFWKAQIFNAMSGAMDFVMETPTFAQIAPQNYQLPINTNTILATKILPPFMIYTLGQPTINQSDHKFSINGISVKPTTPAKEVKIMSKYDIYVMCSDWGSPISELAKIIIKKKNDGLDTTKDEARFDRMIRLQIEYARRVEKMKKSKQKLNLSPDL